MLLTWFACVMNCELVLIDDVHVLLTWLNCFSLRFHLCVDMTYVLATLIARSVDVANFFRFPDVVYVAYVFYSELSRVVDMAKVFS